MNSDFNIDYLRAKPWRDLRDNLKALSESLQGRREDELVTVSDMQKLVSAISSLFEIVESIEDNIDEYGEE